MANEALRYNIALKSQEERLSAIQKEATDRELEAREKLNAILKEQTGALAAQARSELESILDDPKGDAKLAAYKEKWKISDGGWFTKGLEDYVKQIRSFRNDAETETTAVREAFEGMLKNKPKEYEHSDGQTSDTPTPAYSEPTQSTQEPTPKGNGSSSSASKKSAADMWRAQELEELKELREKDLIDETEYQERIAEVQLTYLTQKHARAVAAGEETKALEAEIAETMQQITEQQLAAEEQARREAYETRKAELETQFAEERLYVQECQLEERMSEEEAKAALEEINLRYLESQRQLAEEAGQSTLAIQEKITAAKLAIRSENRTSLKRLSRRSVNAQRHCSGNGRNVTNARQRASNKRRCSSKIWALPWGRPWRSSLPTPL